jgi:hypothetical protein
MPEILELPLAGGIKKDFERFFSTTNSSPSDWSFEGVELLGFGSCIGSFYNKPLSPTCEICGHKIKQNCIFTNKDMEYHIGVVCASNLLALKKYGNIDKLNFVRKVALEKKTILVRIREFEEQRKKIEIEVKYNDEVKWLKDFLDACKNIPDLWGKYQGLVIDCWNLCEPYEQVFNKNIKFFQDLENSINYGKLSDRQVAVLKKCMQEKNIEVRVKEIMDETEMFLIRVREREDREKKMREAMEMIDHLSEKGYRGGLWFKINMWEGHRTFLTSIRNQFFEKQFLTDKQIEAVKKVHDKYCKECKERDLV